MYMQIYLELLQNKMEVNRDKLGIKDYIFQADNAPGLFSNGETTKNCNITEGDIFLINS